MSDFEFDDRYDPFKIRMNAIRELVKTLYKDRCPECPVDDLMAPALEGAPLTTAGALTMPALPPGFPDYQLPEPPPSLAAIKLLPLTVEQIFELMRAPRRL